MMDVYTRIFGTNGRQYSVTDTTRRSHNFQIEAKAIWRRWKIYKDDVHNDIIKVNWEEIFPYFLKLFNVSNSSLPND